jgi:hypothetical protein
MHSVLLHSRTALSTISRGALTGLCSYKCTSLIQHLHATMFIIIHNIPRLLIHTTHSSYIYPSQPISPKERNLCIASYGMTPSPPSSGMSVPTTSPPSSPTTTPSKSPSTQHTPSSTAFVAEDGAAALQQIKPVLPLLIIGCASLLLIILLHLLLLYHSRRHRRAKLTMRRKAMMKATISVPRPLTMTKWLSLYPRSSSTTSSTAAATAVPGAGLPLAAQKARDLRSMDFLCKGGTLSSPRSVPHTSNMDTEAQHTVPTTVNPPLLPLPLSNPADENIARHDSPSSSKSTSPLLTFPSARTTRRLKYMLFGETRARYPQQQKQQQRGRNVISLVATDDMEAVVEEPTTASTASEPTSPTTPRSGSNETIENIVAVYSSCGHYLDNNNDIEG